MNSRTTSTAARTPEFIRFLFVGMANTAVGYGTILLCQYGLGLGYVAANAMGYAVGGTVSYLLNRHYTFASRRAHREALPRFVATVGVCYAINLGMLELAVQRLQWPAPVAQGVAMIAYTLSFYFLSRLVVFRAASTPANGESSSRR